MQPEVAMKVPGACGPALAALPRLRELSCCDGCLELGRPSRGSGAWRTHGAHTVNSREKGSSPLSKPTGTPRATFGRSAT